MDITKSLDHKIIKKSTFSVNEFIAILIQYILSTGLCTIGYYVALTNRVKTKFLSIMFKLLGKNEKERISLPSFAPLRISNFRCNAMGHRKYRSRILLSYYTYRVTNVCSLLLSVTHC